MATRKTPRKTRAELRLEALRAQTWADAARLDARLAGQPVTRTKKEEGR